MSDRFWQMQWEHGETCPMCGLRPDGIPTYRPRDAKALPADVVERQLAFSDTRTADGGAK